jgi:hypothetical protein
MRLDLAAIEGVAGPGHARDNRTACAIRQFKRVPQSAYRLPRRAASDAI